MRPDSFKSYDPRDYMNDGPNEPKDNSEVRRIHDANVDDDPERLPGLQYASGMREINGKKDVMSEEPP